MNNIVLICNVINYLLAQNEAQKNETILLVAVFAFIACVVLFDIFNKNTFAPNKTFKKILLFISLLFIFLFLIVVLVVKK